MRRKDATIDEQASRFDALEMLLAGHGFSAIARATGRSVKWVAEVVRDAMREAEEARKTAALDARAVELARLDALYVEASSIAFAKPKLDGLVETEAPSAERRLRAIAECRALSERRSKLLGLDAPARAEMSGPNGSPISVEARQLIAQKIARMVDAAHK